jgi:hypothetical protein
MKINQQQFFEEIDEKFLYKSCWFDVYSHRALYYQNIGILKENLAIYFSPLLSFFRFDGNSLKSGEEAKRLTRPQNIITGNNTTQ